MSKSPRNLRKAALLLSALDDAQAEVLLRELSPAQALQLQQAVAGLDAFSPDEQAEAIEEFFRTGALLPDRNAAGLELDALGSTGTRLEQFAGEQSTTPFRYLHEAPPRKLIPFLEREHPQTIAVVVSHLPAARAAEILAHLPSALQLDVARRLGDLEETDPDVLGEVERGLEAWLCSQSGGQRRSAGRPSTLASILSAADPRARQHILANLARHDEPLDKPAESSVTPAFTFADVERLDSQSLTTVLRNADSELLVLALAGARPEFAEQAIRAAGSRAAHLRQSLRNLGPTRLSDIEDAKRQLAELARQLEQRGEISPELRGHLSLAV